MTEAIWGMRFNEYLNYQRVGKGQKPEGCPEWLESSQIHTWQEPGLIIWNHIDRKIESLHGADSLRLLSELNSQHAWKSNGVSVTRLVHRFEINLPSGKKRKKGEPAPDVEKPKGEAVYEEIIHLPPEAGYELIELLESKKQPISKMAEQEKKRIQAAMRQFWDSVIELSQKKEMNEFDFKTRSFEWQRDDASRMICHYQTAEGRIWLAKDKFFWNTCIKREGHVGNSHHFVKFVDAVDWVEKEIVELANEPDVKKEGRILSEEEIAAILKNESRTIADHYEKASVLFADMVGFTPLSAQLPPVEMVELLNEVFSFFDSLLDKYGVEKIRTIGDSYMVASGVPRGRPDHAQALARMALDMRDYISTHTFRDDQSVSFRIGINSGSMIAGVIGRRKFVYDVWGDAVNVASRMESHGVGGAVQITQTTYELIKDEFVCEPRGTVNVKGKGEMEVWLVISVKQDNR